MREKKIEHNVIMDVKILIDQVARYGKVENQNCVHEAHGCFLVFKYIESPTWMSVERTTRFSFLTPRRLASSPCVWTGLKCDVHQPRAPSIKGTSSMVIL